MKRAAETHHELQTRRGKYERKKDYWRQMMVKSIDRYERYLELKKIWGPGTVLCYQLKHPPSLIWQCYNKIDRTADAVLMRNYEMAAVSSKEQKQFGNAARYLQYQRNVTCVPFQGVFNKYDLDDIFVPVLITPERFRELFYGMQLSNSHSMIWDLYMDDAPPLASQFAGGYAIFL